jgi:hypothetical protein
MAARKLRWHPDEVKDRIRATQLINRLENHALSEKPLMDNSQVQAASKLLNKVLPDIKYVEGKQELSGSIKVITGVPRAED